MVPLGVPNEIVDSVWNYLKARYDNDNLFLKEFDAGFSTKIADAVAAAERVREAVSREALRMGDGTDLPSVTISMGVTELRADQTVPDILKTADAAMYRAKQAGRNRVVTG